MYIEQSPLKVPKRLRGRIKRPDYLVGIPHAGILAFDVKAKSVYEGDFMFDLEEVEKLARFAYFACLDLERPDHHWWVPLRDLQLRRPERRGKRRVVRMSEAEAYEVSLCIPDLIQLLLDLKSN